MSVHFNGTTDKLSWTGQLLSAYPYTVFCWIKPSATGTSEIAVDIGKNDLTEGAARIYYSASGPEIRSSIISGSTSYICSTAVDADPSNWQPVMMICTSATDRRIYYKTTSFTGTETTNITPSFASTNRVVVGVAMDGSSLPWAGDIAELWVWSVARSSSDFTTLAGDTKPEVAFSSNIVEGWTLSTGGADQVGFVSRTLTATGTSTGATHPITRSGGSGPVTVAASGSASTGGIGTQAPGISIGL